ncbi:MAG: hypothetical protein WAV05_05300 [Anaerolineales bacterium]
MKISQTIKTTVSIIFLACIGALFALKYSARVVDNSNWPYFFAALFFLIYIAIILFLWHLDWSRFSWANNQRLLLALMAILTIGAILFVSFSPETSRVSRLTAMNEWIDRLLAGKYPWSLSVQFDPSGLPFLFIMAMPFYFLGNIGYLEVIGIILLWVALFTIYTEPRARWLPFSALVLLPMFYYEVIVRSELLFNLTLIIVLVLLSERYLDVRKMNIQFFGLAILFGLGLSTRTIVGLVYAGYYVYKFRQQIWHGILFSMFTLVIFGLTLLPFIIWNPNVFFTEGPFFVQFLHLPLTLAGLFVIIIVLLAWKALNLREVIFFEGILLFVIVTVAFLSKVAEVGVNSAVLKDGFDITYFIFSVPFFLLSLGETSLETDKDGATGTLLAAR